MKNVLFLGASVSQVPAIRRARTLGYRALAVDGNPDAVGFDEADLCWPIDFSDVAQVVAVVSEHEIAGVVAISTDRAVPIAAAVAERLGLPGVGTDVARRMTDKAAMRRCLQEHGVPQPPFLEIAGDTVSPQAAEAVGFPAVLKPADSGGQRGVFLIHDLVELEQRLPEALAFSRTGRAILERYLEGRELNGIVVVRDGEPHVLTLSDRLRPPGPGFGVGWIHRYPSDLPPSALVAAEEVAAAAVTSLGLRDGIGFPQLLVTDDGEPHVVEVAARIPAGQMADLVRLATGVDLFDIALAQGVGERITDEQLSPRFDRPIAIRFLTASPGLLPVGRVLAVEGLERARAAAGVLDVGSYIRVGEIIRPVQVDEDRRGYVIATAATVQEALELAQDAAREIVVRVEPLP